MQRTQKQAYDKEGAFAQSGTLNMELLQAMLRDTYFTKLPPKSTGREYFNEAWLDGYLQNFQCIKDADIQRTLLELTAATIANEANRLGVEKLIICGGGAKNSFLMQRLDRAFENITASRKGTKTFLSWTVPLRKSLSNPF